MGKGAPAAPAKKRADRNTVAPPSKGDHAYVGVMWQQHFGKWAAMIWVNEKGRVESIAHFDDPYSAAVAHDRVALHLMGPRGRLLNFPKKKLVPASIDDIRAERRRDRAAGRKSRTGNGYVGVYSSNFYGELRWMAQIWIGGRLMSVGRWVTPRAASLGTTASLCT